MRILYHHRTLGDGAEGIHIGEMVNAFRKLGHKVKIVSPIGDQTNVNTPKVAAFIRIKHLIPKFFYEIAEVAYNIYGYDLLRRAVNFFKPDFIYDRYITFNASSILAGKRYKIPVILEVNSPLAMERAQQKDEKLYLRRLAFNLERWICANSDKTVVVSTPLKDYLVSMGVPQSKVVVMPNGVNLRKFKPMEKNKKLMRELNIHENNIVIGFVGILRPWHGIDLLLKAFYNITKKIDNIYLLIVGEGPIRDEIEKQIRDYGLTEKVTITGRMPHGKVPDYISLFDIAVSPKATFYASPMKILEYMAQAKAVVAPKMRNIEDIILDEKDGILFEPDNAMSLQNTILKLSREPQLRLNLEKTAYSKIEGYYKWEDNAQKVIDLAEEIQKIQR